MAEKDNKVSDRDKNKEKNRTFLFGQFFLLF